MNAQIPPVGFDLFRDAGELLARMVRGILLFYMGEIGFLILCLINTCFLIYVFIYCARRAVRRRKEKERWKKHWRRSRY